MKIFIDSANIEEIRSAMDIGFIDGVTTNPSLIAKNSGKNFHDIIKEISELCKGHISVEVSAEDYDKMIIQGDKILNIADNIVLKLPITINGLKACSFFSSQGKLVNMTLCFTLSQAILAAKAGAKYISPFIGRLEDINQDGLSLISDIKIAYSNYPELSTEILAASIRNQYHFYEICKIGADVSTLPYNLITKLLHHPQTDKGLEIFNNDWKNSGLEI